MYGTTLTTKDPELDIITDQTDPNCIYMGTAINGTLTSIPKWTIKRVKTVGSIIYIGWAFNAIYDNRATVTYSL